MARAALLAAALLSRAAARLPPGERILSYLHARGEALHITAPRPVVATYIDYRDINWQHVDQTVLAAVKGGFNAVILAFDLTTGPTDMLEGWAQLDATVRNATLATAHAAGAVILLSAGGASEEPYARVSGAAYGAAVGATVNALGLDGADFDLENVAPGFNFAPLMGAELVDWLVNATVAARGAMGADALLTHAPQAPYFGPIGDSGAWVGASGGYTAVWAAANASIDFFNVQVRAMLCRRPAAAQLRHAQRPPKPAPRPASFIIRPNATRRIHRSSQRRPRATACSPARASRKSSRSALMLTPSSSASRCSPTTPTRATWTPRPLRAG
jgi:hypothetical protein